MSRSIYIVGLAGVLGCSGAGAGARASTPAGTTAGGAATARVQHTPTATPRAAAQPTPSTAALEYHDESESDRVFIENAERAIRQYSEFLARAGDSPEYAQAAKRSREQIEDLREAIVFVRAGAAQRAAH